MALDSVTDRGCAQNFGCAGALLPVPSGTVDQYDRLQLLDLYSGLYGIFSEAGAAGFTLGAASTALVLTQASLDAAECPRIRTFGESFADTRRALGVIDRDLANRSAYDIAFRSVDGTTRTVGEMLDDILARLDAQL